MAVASMCLAAILTVVITDSNVTLTCSAPGTQSIVAARFCQVGLGQQYVCVYRDGQLDPEAQHPAYEGRVKLLETQPTDGISVVLMNKTVPYSGNYSCCVHLRLPTEPGNDVAPRVSSSGHANGHGTGHGSATLLISLLVIVHQFLL